MRFLFGTCSRPSKIRPEFRCRTARWFLPLILALVSAGSALAQTLPKETPNGLEGTWRWDFTMPDGTAISPKLKIKSVDGTLAGTTALRAGSEAKISNLQFDGKTVSFDVVREGEGGHKATTHYQGVLDGKRIQGRIESNWTGEKKSYAWEAYRAFDGANGTWHWITLFGDRKIVNVAHLKHDGEKLTGRTGIRGRAEIEIKNGSMKEGEVFFEIERGRREEKFFARYQGKLVGDTIKGTIVTDFGGTERTLEWDAVRAE